MASSSNSSASLAFLLDSTRTHALAHFTRHRTLPPETGRNLPLLMWKRKRKSRSFVVFSKKQQENALKYNKLGDSDLVISEITLGTMTYDQQNTEKEAHEMISYAFERGINVLDTAEMYPVPPQKRDPRKDRPVYWKLAEDSTPRQAGRLCELMLIILRKVWRKVLNALIQIILTCSRFTGRIGMLHHLENIFMILQSGFQEYFYDPAKWRESIPFAEQLRGFQELVDQVKEVTAKYLDVARKHGLSLVELALAFVRDRPFVTSSIIGATSMEQLREDIDSFFTTDRPLPPEVVNDIDYIFRRYKDPVID